MATISLLELVKLSEGYRAHAYWDATGHVWTVGFGETLGVTRNTVMSYPEALARLSKRLDEFQSGVRALLRTHIPTQNQLDAMTSLAYNIGLGAFAKSSIYLYFCAGRLSEAANAFRLYRKSGGKVLPGLVTRRERERTLFLKP